MNIQKSLKIACATAVVALPVGLMAQATVNTAPTEKGGVESNVDALRVDDQAVTQDLTAKDFIGQTVVDRNGEKVGDIADIGLGAGFFVSQTSVPLEEKEQSSIDGHVSGMERPSGDQDIGRSMNAEPTVYISVGGVLGVANDHVRVPASALNWNTADKCFQLNVEKASIEALAEKKASGYTGTES